MLTVLFIFLIGFLCSFILTPLVRTKGHRLGIMDIPVELSIHNPPIPRTGGLAMFVGFLMAIGYAWAKGLFNNEGKIFFGILIGATVICLAGFLDDSIEYRRDRNFFGSSWEQPLPLVWGFGLELFLC